jgi:hypothetical protein
VFVSAVWEIASVVIGATLGDTYRASSQLAEESRDSTEEAAEGYAHEATSIEKTRSFSA